MKPKIAIVILLTGVILSYIIGLLGDPFPFLIFLAIFLLALLFTILLLVINLIWKLLPQNIRKIYEPRKMRFRMIILGSVLFILFIALLRIVSSKTYKYIEPASTGKLKSLPYLTWVPAKKTIEKRGVVKYNQEKSFDGINIYNSRNLTAAYLTDMSGNILHTWLVKKGRATSAWHHIEMCKNGDLLAIAKDRKLTRLDWDSNIKWIKRMRFHHDIAIAENKDIYTIARKDEMVFISCIPVPILNDYIVVLSPDGRIKKEIPFFEILRKQVPGNIILKIYSWIIKSRTLKEIIKRKIIRHFTFEFDSPADILHMNTVELINKDINGIFKKGNILFCSRQLDLIGVIDIKEAKLLWSWGRNYLERPHHPTLLENGNILVFDNGCKRKYSRIIELNPFTKKIVWEYKAKPPDKFYSGSRGGNQRLPNGNTLITETDNGRVFEVTKDGEMVWEFYNPEINELSKTRASIYRMIRITDLENYPKLKELK